MQDEQEKPRIGKREERRIERRNAILAVATRCFLENGYAGTTMSSISAELGGSKGTLWSYFASKEELFAAILDQLMQEFRGDLTSALNPSAPLRSALETFCARFMQKILHPQSVALHRLIVGESGRSPEVGRIFYDCGPGVIEPLLIAFFTRHIESGRLKPCDPIQMKDVLLSLSTGILQFLVVLGVEPVDERKIEARATFITDTFLALFENRADAARTLSP